MRLFNDSTHVRIPACPEKITVPTLLIAGDKDILTPLEDSKYLADHLALSILHVMQNVGHMSVIEKTKRK